MLLHTKIKLTTLSLVAAGLLAACGGGDGGGVAFPPVAALPPPSTDAPPDDDVPPEIVNPLPTMGALFEDQRVDMLKALSQPIVYCLPQVNTRDTDNYGVNGDSPIFHGCYDWHSSVHAAYSLYSIYRHTGEELYLRVVDSVVRSDLMDAELQYMQQKVFSNSAERFYGLSWFLALAKERELATGKTDMRPLATAAAQSVRQSVEALTADQARRNVLNNNYQNLSWALIHLDLWGKYAGDAELVDFARSKAQSYLLDPTLDQDCPIENDVGAPRNFFSPCLMRVAAVAKIFGTDQLQWLNERVSDNLYFEPINVDPADHSHNNGDNFSRAFALWWIHQVTNQKSVRANAIRLLVDQMAWRSRWDYSFYLNDLSHWIAQYAVRMIDASYEPNAPTTEAERPLQLSLGDAWAFGGTSPLPDGTAYADQLKQELKSRQGEDVRLVNIAKAVGYTTNPVTLANLVDKRLPDALELIAAWQRSDAETIRSPRLITLHTGFDLQMIKPSTPEDQAEMQVRLQDQNAKMAAANDWAIVRANLNTVLSQLRAAAPTTKIIIGTYDNAYRDCPLPIGKAQTEKTVSEYLEGREDGTKGLNDVIREVAGANGVAVADVYGKLGPGDWNEDCTAPSPQGQGRVAAVFKSLL